MNSNVKSMNTFEEIFDHGEQLIEFMKKDISLMDYNQIRNFQSDTGMRMRYSMQNIQQNVISSTRKVNVNNKYYKLLNQNTYVNQIEEHNVNDELNESQDEVPEDKVLKKYIGSEAVQSYYKHYKKLDRIIEQNKISNINQSPYTAILSISKEEKLLPSKLGIIKQRGDGNQIQCNNFKFGDKYIKIMSEGIGRIPNLSVFKLAGNRITENGASHLISQIMKNGKTIDLKNNKIGKIGTEHLSHCLSSKDCWLEELNLEDNMLGDANIMLLLDSILDNNTLRILNISKNYITNQVGDKLKQLLDENRELKELYLHWNNIKGLGGSRIFDGLKTNEYLKVLDLSWNNMGSDENSEECIKNITECFQTNSQLLHLDLSNNCFNLQESKKIGEAIKNNQTIYGFHFEGNQGFVDNHGFLIVEDNQINNNMGQNSVSHRIEGVNCVYTNKRIQGELLQNQCWICGGWSQQEFIWKLNESGVAEKRPIYIHMDFEGYMGRYTGKCKRVSKQFHYNRMVPPGKLMFLFTANGYQQAAKNYTIIQNQEQTIMNVDMMNGRFNMDLESCEQRNIINLKINKDIIDKEDYTVMINIKPRSKELIFIPPKDKVFKKKWEFKNSIMFPWKPDTQDQLDKCLDFDWMSGRINKVIKDEEDNKKVKERWRKSYRAYKDCYKYYSAMNPIGDIWALSQLSFSDLIYQTTIIDNVLLQAADVDIKFIATTNNIEYKSNPRNPVRGLVRFELMECLIRVADERLLKKGQNICNNYTEAIEMFLNDYFDPVFIKYDSQKWREDIYWNEPCDEVFKTYKVVLEAVYKKFSAKKVKPGQKSFMCLEEIYDICKQNNLYDENYVERDANIAFNLSMMTQIDELNNDRIFQMQFVEFLECVARISEKFSPQPLVDMEPLNYEQRFALPLHLKTEAMMIIFLKNIVDVNMKEQWLKQPRQSLFKEKAKEAEDSDDFED